MKEKTIKCIACKGTGVLPAPRKKQGDRQKEMIRVLVSNGFSYREVCTLLGIKSVNSITRVMREK